MFKKLLTVFALFLTIDQIFGSTNGCPDAEIVKPCICYVPDQRGLRTIVCGGSNNYDLGEVFDRISKHSQNYQKNYKSFYLTNTAITELKENTFKDITFDGLNIEGTKITKIHENAFNGTDKVANGVVLNRNRALSGSPSLFKALSKFTNAYVVVLSNNNITEIPDNAFQTEKGHNDAYTSFSFEGQEIKKIGANAFADYTNLMAVRLWNTSIETIPDKAFALKSHSVLPYNASLYIGLRYNRLFNSSSFFNNAFTNINTYTVLALESEFPSIHYLDEKVFKPFLDENSKNQFYADITKLDCQDCRNYWLIKDVGVLPKVHHLVCSNGKPINDPSNFKTCK